MRGELIGITGNYPENGNWVPHLHFQCMLSTLGYSDDFPGVAYYRELDVWASLCPDPNLVFSNAGLALRPGKQISETLAFRQKHLGKSLSLSYREPLKIVRGSGPYLIDHTGRKYLDTVNNVAHVGHEHPRVVKAGQRQMAVLNTNTRYLNDNSTEHRDQTRHEALTEEFLSLANLHYREQREVSFYADKLHLTPKYLSKIIKQNSGKSANQWVDDNVMLEARALLRSTNMNIQQISDHLHFPSQSSFGKYFKRKAGVSPKEYRKSDSSN